jgi:hypothetical protein
LVFTEKSRRTHVSAKKPSLRHRQGYLTDEESYLNILQCLTLTLLDQSSWIASKANDGKKNGVYIYGIVPENGRKDRPERDSFT